MTTQPHSDQGKRSALAILNEAMGDIACVDWPDDARTYIARAAAALELALDEREADA